MVGASSVNVSLPVPRGTFLNTATVAAGSLIGLAIGANLHVAYKEIAMGGIALVTLGMGMKMFLQSRNVVIVAMSVALGGMLGLALGIQAGIESFAEWAKGAFGGGGQDTFTTGLVAASVLFCVGPMTLIGCVEDGLEGKMDLLALKSTMDGIVSVFMAAAWGQGVLVSALVVLVVQGTLTLLAGLLRPIAKDPDMLAELSGAGGVILMGIALGLLELKELHTANFLPALALGPAFSLLLRRVSARRAVLEG